VAQFALFTNAFLRGPDVQLHDGWLPSLGRESLPSELGRWNQFDYRTVHRGANDSFGEFSQLWEYQSGVCRMTVSLDYPFRGWHELPDCYVAHGWRVARRAVLVTATADQRVSSQELPENVVEVDVEQSNGEQGYLLFVVFDGSGQTQLAERSLGALLQWRIDRGLQDFGFMPVTYQFQLFMTSPTPIDDGTRLELRRHFKELHGLLRREWRTHP
jgi:hypothetical protein